MSRACDARKTLSRPRGRHPYSTHKGDYVSPDPAKRKKSRADFKRILDAAAALGATGAIWAPCLNGESSLSPKELDKIMLEDLLPELAEYAVKAGTRTHLEPLTRLETFYVNRLDQAAALYNKINSPGVCMMGDFYHMAREERDLAAAFVSGGKWVHHVHLATRNRRVLPGQEPQSFVAGFQGLKQIGYQDFCSLEFTPTPVRRLKDPPGKISWWQNYQDWLAGGEDATEIPKAFAFLKQQWDLAKI